MRGVVHRGMCVRMRTHVKSTFLETRDGSERMTHVADVSDFVEIPLTQGYVAIVDAEDAPELLKHKWCVSKSLRVSPRAVRGANAYRVLMHRLIMNAPDGLVVDHKNGDGLDNRKSNLRICEGRFNTKNCGLSARNKSGFKGVTIWKNRRRNPFGAFIGDSGTLHYLGSFSTPEEAARAYDAAAVRLHGEFARLNFPPTTSLAPPEGRVEAGCMPVASVFSLTSNSAARCNAARPFFGGTNAG